MGARYVLCVLLFNIFVENGTVMTSIWFRREMEAVSGILGKCSHEALKRFVKVGCCVDSRICSQGVVGITVRPTRIASVVWAIITRESNDVSTIEMSETALEKEVRELRRWVGVPINRYAVRESNLWDVNTTVLLPNRIVLETYLSRLINDYENFRS